MIRSLLYVPGTSERFIAKAHERGADAIIVDLEDAVVAERKAEARDALPATVAAVRRGGALVFVRINNERERLLADAEAACRAGADGLYVPKVASAGLLMEIAAHLAPIEAALGRRPLDFVPLIEDPGAVFDARDIARGPRVLALSAGAEDIATAMGAEPVPDVLRLPKLLIHMAAKAAGVLSFGLLRTVADYSDRDGMVAAAREARQFGFDGASCIHPSVVPVLNEAFSPSEADLAFARRVVGAQIEARREGRGAFLVDGRFVDAPILARAERLIARAQAVPNPTGGRDA
ncbi:CoA ester lyase [Aureimonas sp. AU22]|uniref:HpcH/HpaI aldolase/citrate lyase family protein n=1 Tax=Aureimonas sp. AU22 TaxID=1638162 RepID=UPI000705969D|nr:CoA ester lyase [Aureimonas sp. AU22]BAT29807.1 D-isomer specific 2-hydroxyacid dehydrogenase, NAD-binding [Aureimonas sp. AU22]